MTSIINTTALRVVQSRPILTLAFACGVLCAVDPGTGGVFGYAFDIVGVAVAASVISLWAVWLASSGRETSMGWHLVLAPLVAGFMYVVISFVRNSPLRDEIGPAGWLIGTSGFLGAVWFSVMLEAAYMSVLEWKGRRVRCAQDELPKR